MATSQLGQQTKLLALPLVSSSLTVFYAAVEVAIFIPFLRSAETEPAATSKVVRLWWNYFLFPGAGFVLATTFTSMIAGGYAIRNLPSNTLERQVCAAGIAFSAGHLVFGPTIANVIKNIRDEQVEKEGGTMTWVRQWLRVHAFRTVLADIPSLLCFVWLFRQH